MPEGSVVAFASSQPLALYVSIYLHIRGHDPFRLVVEPTAVLTDDVKTFIGSLGAVLEVGEPASTPLHSASEVYVHTFARPFESMVPLFQRCSEAGVAISCYADGLKNEFATAFVDRLRPRRLVFFGWVLEKDRGDTPIDVITFAQILRVFKPARGAHAVGGKHEKSLVVMLRYWGGGAYRFKEGLAPDEALMRSVPFQGLDLAAVYVKSDPRVQQHVASAFMDRLSRTVLAPVRPFSALTGADAPIADQLPLEMQWFKPIGAHCYSFDSTVQIFLAALGERKLLFPDPTSIEDIFLSNRGTNTVLRYTSLFQQVCTGIERTGIERPIVANFASWTPLEQRRTWSTLSPNWSGLRTAMGRLSQWRRS